MAVGAHIEVVPADQPGAHAQGPADFPSCLHILGSVAEHQIVHQGAIEDDGRHGDINHAPPAGHTDLSAVGQQPAGDWLKSVWMPGSESRLASVPSMEPTGKHMRLPDGSVRSMGATAIDWPFCVPGYM
eukprot:CAMPEP_0177496308 /NCGR_PEP_ID=MMETSP0369-20130122/34437_1 /TAXON_ID=447022 ORGANISM="Scrippsiella hangoei-like, Strain SHHI-4" /NCGR_SAMPLE_ID=MMETSP0369 /ASSEMBLY_ACC=CAM_ASM_000364 /LENGTH=128 /DNA_ID=CAMNT_0018973369 /DNA_START=401 /DNA_END=788 /DNA_ORIENTATION=-